MRRRSIVGLALAGLLSRAGRAQADDAGAIRAMMAATFDRPGAPLAVGPVVTAGDHAVAGWTQGDMGGRALLRRRGSVWSITLCAGDALKSDAMLRDNGVPEAQARLLAERVAAAERDVEPARLALFASFMGVVAMEPAPK